MNKTITNYLSAVKFGDIQQFKAMVTIPLFTKINENYKYLTLKEALDKELLTVKEIDHGGSVPELKVINKGNIPVFLLDGEELIGAKQNRVLNTSILLKAKFETIIPVSCTEEGRWSHTTDKFYDSGVVMSHKTRKLKTRSIGDSLKRSKKFVSDQGEVWEGIKELSHNAKICSPTRAMKDIFESKKEDIDNYLKAFPCLPSQKGIMVFVNGKVEGFDIVSLSSAYKNIHSKLLKSYAIDSILDKKDKNNNPSIDNANNFIKKAMKCRGKKYESNGIGLDYRFETNKIVGSSLVCSEKVIHVAFFSITEFDKTGNISSLRRRKEHRIY